VQLTGHKTRRARNDDDVAHSKASHRRSREKQTVELIYFPERGEAELIRLLLVEAGIQYKDWLLDSEKKFKEFVNNGASPYHKAPVLKIDGQSICETRAIEHYVATSYNLMGSTLLDSAKIISLVEAVARLSSSYDFVDLIDKNNPDTSKKRKEFIDQRLPMVCNKNIHVALLSHRAVF
jgi:hypothetical protein